MTGNMQTYMYTVWVSTNPTGVLSVSALAQTVFKKQLLRCLRATESSVHRWWERLRGSVGIPYAKAKLVRAIFFSPRSSSTSRACLPNATLIAHVWSAGYRRWCSISARAGAPWRSSRRSGRPPPRRTSARCHSWSATTKTHVVEAS